MTASYAKMGEGRVESAGETMWGMFCVVTYVELIMCVMWARLVRMHTPGG